MDKPPKPYGMAESQHTATFSGLGNQGWQLGQNLGNVAETINIYGSDGRTSDSAAAGRSDHAGRFSYSLVEPVKAYVPRPHLSDQIRKQLCEDATDEATKTLIVWGLGGVGKTQLVLDYVRKYRNDYKALFWIETGRKESLERDIVNLWRTLRTQPAAGQDTVDVESAVIGVKSWFSGRQGPWLMVFDSADTIENERASDYIDIKHFIPDAASLHVVVTTRSSQAKDMTRLEGIQVGEMETEQAVELFFRYSRLKRENRGLEDNIEAIVKELGCLALAVTLASTYVGRTPRLQSDIEAYLPEYKRRRRELLSQKAESLIHQYSESVLTTWEASYQAVREQCPEAANLMTILSFLNFDDIFLQLFGVDAGTENTESTNIVSTTGKALTFPKRTVDIYQIERCFDMLQRYSLVQWKEDRQSFAMHKLVHAWGYDRLTLDEQDELSLVVLELVAEAIDGCGSRPKDKLRLVPHIMANFSTLGRVRSQMIEGTLKRLATVGFFVSDLGRWSEAHEIRELILKGTYRLHGEEHPYTLTAMHNLAITLELLGQRAEAATMMKQVLERRRRILGEEHADTLAGMHNLAATLGHLGQLAEAATMQREVLEKRRRILGEEHPDTLSTMHNLADTLRRLGYLAEAVIMQREVLEKMRRILGEEHPDTVSAMDKLAMTLGHLGQLAEAATMQREVLEKRRQILGEEHPETLSAMYDLVNTLGTFGQLTEAATMKKEVLEKIRRISGEEHPDTLSAMGNLAMTLGHLGQLAEAATMQREVLEKRRGILGEEHPNTLAVMHSLAVMLGKQGQLDEAIALLEPTVQKMRRLHDGDDPGMRKATRNLAALVEMKNQEEKRKKTKEGSLYSRRKGKLRRKAA